jgi:hypothetical protein
MPMGRSLFAALSLLLVAATGALGQTVTIDPESGKFVESLPPREARGEKAASARSHPGGEDLDIQDSPVAGGGQFVELGGRFRHSTRVEEGGKPLCDRAPEPSGKSRE